MNTQDIIHQAQDVFDRVTHRSSPLLPTCVEHKSDTFASASSVLTNVTPPSALPSFIASPLPSVTPAPPPVTASVPPPVTASVSPPVIAPVPPPVAVPFSPSCPVPLKPEGTTAVGSLNSDPIPATGLTSCPSPTPSSHAPVLSASNPAIAPPSIHPQEHSPAGSVPRQTLEPSFVSSSNQVHPVTSQPQPPARQRPSLSLITKGHSRHHSYPVYVPGNPMHNPPPPPTPPCLIIQQDQATSLSLSKSHNYLSTCSEADSSVGLSYYYREPYASSSTAHMNVMENYASYGYAYSPCSHGSVDASASVDLGSPSVGGPAGKPGGSGWFGWIRGTVSSVSHRVAERAKSSMDTMITTLDPQMKEFIHSGGDMDIVVASDKEIKVGAVREAFQFMFGKATVSGMAAQAEGVAAQPVGFEAALQSAELRINSLRSSGCIHPQQPIVSVENFIVELTPECWFDIGLLLLDDPGEDILLQTYTQVTPVPPNFVTQARDSTPDDYPYRNSGFATTVGQIASQNLQVHHTMWQETLTGVSRREMIVLAARTLAGLYKSRLPFSH